MRAILVGAVPDRPRRRRRRLARPAAVAQARGQVGLRVVPVAAGITHRPRHAAGPRSARASTGVAAVPADDHLDRRADEHPQLRRRHGRPRGRRLRDLGRHVRVLALSLGPLDAGRSWSPRSPAPASASCAATSTRPGSSWATPGRCRSASCSPRCRARRAQDAAAVAVVFPLVVLLVPLLDTSFVVLKRLKYGQPLSARRLAATSTTASHASAGGSARPRCSCTPGARRWRRFALAIRFVHYRDRRGVHTASTRAARGARARGARLHRLRGLRARDPQAAAPAAGRARRAQRGAGRDARWSSAPSRRDASASAAGPLVVPSTTLQTALARNCRRLREAASLRRDDTIIEVRLRRSSRSAAVVWYARAARRGAGDGPMPDTRESRSPRTMPSDAKLAPDMSGMGAGMTIVAAILRAGHGLIGMAARLPCLGLAASRSARARRGSGSRSSASAVRERRPLSAVTDAGIQPRRPADARSRTSCWRTCRADRCLIALPVFLAGRPPFNGLGDRRRALGSSTRLVQQGDRPLRHRAAADDRRRASAA